MRGPLEFWAAMPIAFSAAAVIGGCSSKSVSFEGPSGSEVAVSVVSGGLNNTSGSSVAFNLLKPHRPSFMHRVLDALDPIPTASAAVWSCSGGSLSPSFNGPGGNPYTYTPVSCMVTWGNDRAASADWSGSFILDYGPTCDATHAFLGNQVAGCSVTRTTAPGGNTRTITGPDGNSYAITHDTNGQGTAWDATEAPVAEDGGVIATGTSLVINGSHLTGTVEINGEKGTIWDHTVMTDADGITVTGAGTDRIVSGTVYVHHNILKFTTATAFDGVTYGNADCCFPTGGSVTTTVVRGTGGNPSESLTFTPVCGESVLTDSHGTSALTLQHCL
jgi:hypothetical protein